MNSQFLQEINFKLDLLPELTSKMDALPELVESVTSVESRVRGTILHKAIAITMLFYRSSTPFQRE